MKPLLILVGADKGGVGKTTTSRALLDFLARRNILARAFDTENPRGTLHRFYPNITEIIDLQEVRDQMKVLDTMQEAAVKVSVVDLKAGSMSRSLETFENIGVLDAARSGDFDMALFHVVGPSIASLDEMGEIAQYTKGISYIVARNFINETNFFEWDEKTFKKYFAGLSNAREIEIPKLNEMAYEQVDLAGVTFSDFLQKSLENTVDTIKAGEKMSAKAVTGEADVTEVVQAVTQAELALQTVVALRDRLVSAYQDIMRMPI